MTQFICYPRCTTCQKALKFLKENGIEPEIRNIREARPTKEELREWHARSGLDIKRFFNTSGNVYKELQLKDRLPGMTLEEKLDILSTDGMLVKRPLLVTEEKVLVGFRPEEWSVFVTSGSPVSGRR